MASPLSHRPASASGPGWHLVMILLSSFLSQNMGCMLPSHNQTTPCGSHQCLNGMCLDGLNVCHCEDGWLGDECDQCCDLTCDVGTCQIGEDGNLYCDSLPTVTGSAISATTLPHEYPCDAPSKEVFEHCDYSNNECFHGNCNMTLIKDETNSTYWVEKCHCFKRWEGIACDQCCDLACENGYCFHDSISHRQWCNCHDNYTGEFCETMITPGEYCSSFVVMVNFRVPFIIPGIIGIIKTHPCFCIVAVVFCQFLLPNLFQFIFLISLSVWWRASTYPSYACSWYSPRCSLGSVLSLWFPCTACSCSCSGCSFWCLRCIKALSIDCWLCGVLMVQRLYYPSGSFQLDDNGVISKVIHWVARTY